jgi:hypothetical protein
MNKQLLINSLKLTLGIFVFILIFNQFIGWAITEKSWFERLWITLAAGGGFGVAGAGIGLLIGGIGLALGGGAIGLAGWLAFGVLGFGTGALGGSIYTIILNPSNYDIDTIRLVALVAFSAIAAMTVVLFMSKTGRLVIGYINKDTDVKMD